MQASCTVEINSSLSFLSILSYYTLAFIIMRIFQIYYRVIIVIVSSLKIEIGKVGKEKVKEKIKTR